MSTELEISNVLHTKYNCTYSITFEINLLAICLLMKRLVVQEEMQQLVTIMFFVSKYNNCIFHNTTFEEIDNSHFLH